MECIDGADLSRLIHKYKKFPVSKALDMIIQAGQGLAYAHKMGVVHRDIKPANLLLSRDGVVKILDMGLARMEKPLGGDTAVEAGCPSDPYLMASYDRKTVKLLHDAADEVYFKLQVVPAAKNTWLPYATIRVPVGQTVPNALPRFHRHLE